MKINQKRFISLDQKPGCDNYILGFRDDDRSDDRDVDDDEDSDGGDDDACADDSIDDRIVYAK